MMEDDSENLTFFSVIGRVSTQEQQDDCIEAFADLLRNEEVQIDSIVENEMFQMDTNARETTTMSVKSWRATTQPDEYFGVVKLTERVSVESCEPELKIDEEKMINNA